MTREVRLGQKDFLNLNEPCAQVELRPVAFGDYQLSQRPPANFSFSYNREITLQGTTVCFQKGLHEAGFN